MKWYPGAQVLVRKIEFLRKYFSEDLRNKKEVEFLQLKQESLSVAEYVAKFEVVPI